MTRPMTEKAPTWLLGTIVAAVIAAALAALAVFGAATLPERAGPPVEELTVERAVLSPGLITLTVRGAGADPVRIAQVVVNDSFVDFQGGEQEIGRLETATLRIHHPWLDGQPYLISLLTSTGLAIEHEIPAAVATPVPDGRFIGVMALLGTYVGILPVLLGMLLLPLLRRARPGVTRLALAFTVGLLAFLAIDATLEGVELADRAGGPFGGAALVLLAAALTYILLAGLDVWMRGRRPADSAAGGLRLAVLIAFGIGLHNLGEGLAIGSAFAVGELAVGTALVVGFALHNTTEGLAIVAPLSGASAERASELSGAPAERASALAAQRPALWRLLGLGLLAGAPAILGAVLGAAVDNPTLSAVLLGVGAGAIVLVIAQILPALRVAGKRLLDMHVTLGTAAGLVVMYLTSLLVAA